MESQVIILRKNEEYFARHFKMWCCVELISLPTCNKSISSLAFPKQEGKHFCFHLDTMLNYVRPRSDFDSDGISEKEHL